VPQQYRLILSKRVASDLDAIFNRIAKDSPPNASAFVGRILDAFSGLRIFPHRTVVEGQSPKARNPVRSLAVDSYIVFFRVLDKQEAVRILQVRHGARQRPKRF
jgi:plasmid stabilization system protein ParE